MNKASNVTNLRTRLQHKIEQDRQQIEVLTQEQLKKLEENLRRSVSDALRIIENDIRSRVEDTARRVSAATLWPWLIRPLLIGLGLFLGLLGGSWGLTTALAEKIQEQIGQVALLAVEIETQTQTLEQIETETWGNPVARGKRGEVSGPAYGREAGDGALDPQSC